PRPVQELNPEVPPPLADLVRQLLAKRPEERPESARVVAEVLGGIERGLARQSAETAEATLAGLLPVPPGTRPAAEARKAGRGRWFVGAAVLLLAAAGLAGLFWSGVLV